MLNAAEISALGKELFKRLSDMGTHWNRVGNGLEKAVEAWRRIGEHRTAQARGRTALFDDYRLRIAGVIRDYGMFDRTQAPDDSRKAHPDAIAP